MTAQTQDTAHQQLSAYLEARRANLSNALSILQGPVAGGGIASGAIPSKDESMPLGLAQASIRAVARDSRTEARAKHEDLLAKMDLPLTSADLPKWVGRHHGSNHFGTVKAWIDFFEGDRYMGKLPPANPSLPTPPATDYLIARDLVARYEAAQSFASTTGLFRPASAINNVEPEIIRDARGLIASRDAELDALTAQVRGEVLRHVPIEGKNVSVADVLQSYRNQVLDAQDLHDFADSLLDHDALEAHQAGADKSASAGFAIMKSVWRAGRGNGDNGTRPSSVSISEVLEQVHEKLAGARDRDHAGKVYGQIEGQLRTDRAAGRSMDNRLTLPLTDIAPVPQVDAGAAGHNGRAVIATANGVDNVGGTPG